MNVTPDYLAQMIAAWEACTDAEREEFIRSQFMTWEASMLGLREVRRSGRFWVALCPFHPEETPSFRFDGRTFHCFGCGAGGDVLELVRALRDTPAGPKI